MVLFYSHEGPLENVAISRFKHVLRYLRLPIAESEDFDKSSKASFPGYGTLTSTKSDVEGSFSWYGIMWFKRRFIEIMLWTSRIRPFEYKDFDYWSQSPFILYGTLHVWSTSPFTEFKCLNFLRCWRFLQLIRCYVVQTKDHSDHEQIPGLWLLISTFPHSYGTWTLQSTTTVNVTIVRYIQGPCKGDSQRLTLVFCHMWPCYGTVYCGSAEYPSIEDWQSRTFLLSLKVPTLMLVLSFSVGRPV